MLQVRGYFLSCGLKPSIFVGINTFYDKVPRLIKLFLLRALLIFVGWQLLYNFVLAPVRVPDRFLSNTTAFTTAKLLSVFYNHSEAIFIPPGGSTPSSVTVNGRRKLSILDSCNALDIYVLYISFLFCFPGTWKRRLIFIAIGVPYILLLNTVRCAAIAWLNMNHPELVAVTHHYLFTGLVYILVFYLWVLYSKKLLSYET